MSIVVACIVFVFILAIYVIISEVFTVLFRLTGLREKKARFQVVSLLTNSGYTTAESEAITNDDRRRELARKTMLFGYVFSVSIVSAIVNILFSLKLAQIEELLWTLPFPVILAVVIFFAFKDNRLRIWFSGLIEKIAARVLAKGQENQLLVMDSYGKNIMAQLHVCFLPSGMKNVPLKNTSLRKNGVNVLLIKRRGEEGIPATGDTVLIEDDIIIVFGRISAIETAFELRHNSQQE